MDSAKRITVNSISASRIAFAVLTVYLAMNSWWWATLLCVIVGFISDFADGQLARHWHVASSFGVFFDPLTDKILCLTVIAVIAVFVGPLYWVLFAVFAIYDVTTISLRLKMTKTSPMPTSYIAKVKTALLMGSLVLIIVSILLKSTVWGSAILLLGSILLVAAAVLTVMSLVNYLRYVSRHTIHDWLEFPAGVDKIDFGKWHKEYGIKAVLFDIEGTLTHWNGTEIEDEIITALQNARKMGIRHIGLVSNIYSSQSERVNKIAIQIGADNFQLPNNRGERKPNPTMTYKALKKMQVSPNDAAFVGDKLVDVVVGKRTGMKRVAWVDRLGIEDHPFDRLIYRYVERIAKWLIILLLQ